MRTKSSENLSPSDRRKLIHKLVRNSAVDQRSRLLMTFYNSLDSAGWLIEVARTNLRFVTGHQLSHQTFGEFLALGDARRYRTTVHRADKNREALVSLARYVLTFEGSDSQALNRVVKSPAYVRWHRLLGLDSSSRSRRRGRHIEQTQYLSGSPRSNELESYRVDLGMKLKSWSHKIGTSENTYRRRLLTGDVPDEWVTNARRVVAERRQRQQDEVEQYVAPTSEELIAAETVLWKAYRAKTDELMTGRNDARALNGEAEELNSAETEISLEEPEEFEPSDEVDIDLGEGETG